MFNDFKKIVFGISERTDGKMKLVESVGDDSGENRVNFFVRRGIDNKKIVSASLAHGSNIKIVDESDDGKNISGVDALITNQEDLCLAITVADCAPLYFFDPARKVIAIAHAGWRGVLENITAKTIKEMTSNFASQPEEVQVFIGPHIKVCHFEVKKDVAEMFFGYQDCVINREGRIFIDLAKIIRSQLLAVGVRPENIDFSPDCTYCEDKKYFSWRRDQPKKVEAMLAYLAIIK